MEFKIASKPQTLNVCYVLLQWEREVFLKFPNIIFAFWIDALPLNTESIDGSQNVR